MCTKQNMTVKQRGFSLVEIMITLLLLALIINFGVPAMNSFLERNRLKSAAEEIYNQIKYARSESIKQSRPLYLKFSADGSTAWSLGISNTSGCTITETDATNASACRIDVGGTWVRKVFINGTTGQSYPDISLSVNPDPYEISFDQVRGIATAGVVTLTSTSGWVIRSSLSALGHVKLCSPTGVTNVAGYPSC